VILDTIFDPRNFHNEIVWKRSSAHSDGKQGSRHFGRITDTILFYAKGPDNTWNPQFAPYDPAYVARDYRRVDADGRRYRISDLQGPRRAIPTKRSWESAAIGATPRRRWRS
jgi:adenine specific DNA methylase Mod